MQDICINQRKNWTSKKSTHAHTLIGERGRNIQQRMGTQVTLAEQWY